MNIKLKPGSILTSVIVLIVLAAAVLAMAFFVLRGLDLTPGSQEQDSKNKFNKESVIKSIPFVDSKNQKKRFLVVSASKEGPIPIADSYITDDNMSKIGAQKIEELSQDTSLGYAANIFPSGGGLQISISPDKGKKYIVVSQTVGDATTITIIAEDGTIISESVVNNLLAQVSDKCQCNFLFDNWANGDKFYVKIPVASGETLKAQVDAKNGQVVDGIQKI